MLASPIFDDAYIGAIDTQGLAQELNLATTGLRANIYDFSLLISESV